jgi:hypothetical protein
MGTLEDLQVQEAQLLSQIQGLYSSLARTRIRMAEIRNINQNDSTYKLPNEILSVIFEAGRSSSSYSQTISSISSKPHIPFEVLVSSVSHRWRNVALQTPRLWTDLQIIVSKPVDNLVDLYLHRSKNCLLDITFKQAPLCYPEVNLGHGGGRNNFTRQLGTLVPHVARWRMFVIENIRVGCLETALFLLSDLSAPALEILRVNCSDPSPALIAMFSGGAPLLSSLESRGTYILPPCDNIKSLKIGPCFRLLTRKQLVQMLLPMRSLNHISLPSGAVYDDSFHAPIALPSVLSLDLDLTSCSVGILRFLDLPAVESLTVYGSTDEAIAAFAHHRQSHPAVRILKIFRNTGSRFPLSSTATTTQHFIGLFPSVHEVAFDRTDPTLILRALQNTQPLWPQLSEIVIVSPSDASSSSQKQVWDNVVKVVGNRLDLRLPISRVGLSSQLVGRFTRRQQQGLRTKVTLEEC